MSSSESAKISFLSGDEALAQGAYEEGLKVAASYPGTPATEILEYLSKIPQIDSQWSVNEKVAFEVALSSAIAGLRSLYSSKHVGLNVAMDPLMTSPYIGINAGFIIVSCDDPGLHSSQNEQDSRLIAKIAKIPLLEPASPSEAKKFVKHAFFISEKFDIPVMIRMTTRIAHTKENVAIGPRKELANKDFKINPAKYVMVPRNAYLRHIDLEKRLLKLKEYSETSPLNKIDIRDKKIGFITSGVSYLYAREMYPEASFLKLGLSFPFPEKLARSFANQVKEVFVLEELEPYLEEQVKLSGIKARSKPPSYGIGEIRPEYLPAIIARKEKDPDLSPTRKPVLCPGCGHRPVFWVLKKLKLTVSGDIGCYTLGALAPLNSLHSCLCMGSAITFLEGWKKSLGKNVVAVIGDSTFVHTGIAGLINLSYNKTNGLVLILDNATTAMTGSQPHPATGITARGETTKKLVLEDICKASGADNVDIIDPYRVKELEGLIKRRLDEPALSVIICRSPCRILEKRKAPLPVYDQKKCGKCYLCLGINCPAIVKSENGYIRIDQIICTGCKLCVETCKFGALENNG